MRLQNEEFLKDVLVNNDELKKRVDEANKHHKKCLGEMEALNETLRQIEKYNEEMQSEIELTRRVTYKTEQNIQNLEGKKENQDVYVDNMNKQIKTLKERIIGYKLEISQQSDESSEAHAVLQETIRELELVASEKKGLMLQWKSALVQLSRLDEALAKAKQTLDLAESAVHDFDVQIEAARRNIQSEQARNESLVSVRDRLNSELQWVEENLTKMRVEREQLQERYTLLSKSLLQTEVDAKKLDSVTNQLRLDIESILQSLQAVTQERQKLEEEVQLTYGSNSNASKAVQNLRKNQAAVLKRIHLKENEETEIQNEISRTQVDALDATSVKDQLQEHLASAHKELKDKENVIEKYQLEIRQRNDEIDKKMYLVDRLNKKYEKIIEMAGGEENLGPLESTIRNISRETATLQDECKELEREWLRRQTEMVSVVAESESVSEENVELQSRVTILSQQQLRLLRDLKDMQIEARQAQLSNVDSQKDVSKLNALISLNHDEETQLQNANYVLEMESVEELREMEKESIGLQASVNEVSLAKAALLDEIIETERQALLWEKKIQLDRETREALDPSIGQLETQLMEKEIHRMSLRYEALLREQERLSSEMERAILKRSTIAVRYSTTQSKDDNRSSVKPIQEFTQSTVKKKIAALKRDARGLAEESSRYDSAIEAKRLDMTEMTSNLERSAVEFSSAEETNVLVQAQINDLLYQKQLRSERIAYRQKYLKRLKEVTAAGIDSAQILPVERKLLSATQALDNVRDIIADLQKSHPHLNDVLHLVATMADPGI
jgi:chromosome segregation ATPase